MIAKFFRIEESGTTIAHECIAGFTTFTMMVYVVVVNPKILVAAGLPFGPSMVATTLTAFFGTLAMGIYAGRPYAVAPFMGQNAFIAFTVVQVLGYSWQQALGTVFVSGVLSTIATLIGLRAWLAVHIPGELRTGFSAGIGFFLIFVGFNTSGIVEMQFPALPTHVSNLHDPRVLLVIFGFLFMGVLRVIGVKGAILMAVIITSLVGFSTGVAPFPEKWIEWPPGLGPIFGQLEFSQATSPDFFLVVFTILLVDFVTSVGTLLGLRRTALTAQNHELPGLQRPLLCDAVTTVFAPILGTTSSGTYTESAAGIAAGGKTDLTSVVTAFLFLIALFLAPFFEAIPSFAYGPAMIMIGIFMLRPMENVNFTDPTQMITIFSIVALMCFTYNLAIGILATFPTYAVLKTAAGKWSELHPVVWILAAISCVFFIFSPF